MAFSHKKNPRIFECIAGENRRIFSQNPARPQPYVFFNGSIFFSEEHTFFIDFVTYISLLCVLLYNGRNENEKV